MERLFLRPAALFSSNMECFLRGPTEKKCLFSMLKKACLDSPSLTGHTHKRKGSLWGTSHVQAAARRVLRTLLYKGSRRDKRSSCLEGLFRKGGFFVRGTGSPFFSQRGGRPGGAEQEPLGKLLTEGIPAGLGAIRGKGGFGCFAFFSRT